MRCRIAWAHLFKITGRRLAIPLALLLTFVLVACSDATPTPSPTPASAPTSPPAASPTATPAAPAPTATATKAPPSTQAPTVAPTPSPTAAPTEAPESPEPTASPPADPAAQEVFQLLTELVHELGHREGGTDEEHRAAELLKARFDALGYSAELESFAFEHFDLAGFASGNRELATVAVQSPMQTVLPGIPISTTPNGSANSGPLTPVELIDGTAPAAGELDGKIAFIQHDELPLGDSAVIQGIQNQVNQVAQAGAVAAVITSTRMDFQGYRPLIAAPSPIPALIVPPDVGNLVAGQLASTEVVVSVNIQTSELKSSNVIAELKGEGDDVVIVGAHYDVVPQTESGPNDNTSGIAMVLSLAKALKGESLPFTVRFILFGAEELGLYGSIHHVSSLGEEELAQLRGMLNFDVVATGPFIAAVGHPELVGFAEGTGAGLGVDVQAGQLPPGASSDHQPFEHAGVPVLMLYAPDVSRIHSPNDLLEFVQPERLGDALLVSEAMLKSPEIIIN